MPRSLSPNTYEGRPCKNCAGTLRYYMKRDGVPGQPGPCVACICAQVRSKDEPYRKTRYRQRDYKDNSKPKSDRVRLGVRDPTAGGAFADSIRHHLRAGHA